MNMVSGVIPLAAMMVMAGANATAAEWFAEVETTAGAFTIRLDWENAPNGCGAFAALAEGLTDWVNPQSGKAEKGVEYFPGTAMSWVQHDENSEALLLGNRGRLFTGADGTANVSNGSGLTLEDDIRDGGGRGLAARSVAMMNAGGPDTLDGRWAVFLKDGEAYYGGKWSRIGTVASNWGLVESIANGARDTNSGMLESPATVTGVRVWSVPAEAMEAWRAAATNWPSCGQGDVAVDVSGTNGTLHCGWRPKSQYAVVHCGDLREAARNIVWMDWNDGAEEALAELPFRAGQEKGGDGAMWFGPRQFCAVAEAEYPELGGPEFPGGEGALLAEWQWGDGTVERYLHELDWAAGTGTVWRATEEGGWTNDSSVIALEQWRAGAHSRELLVVCPMWMGPWPMYFLHYYQFGEEGGDGRGRFRLDLHRIFSNGSEYGEPVEVWGDYRRVQADGESGEKAGRRGGAGRSKPLCAPMPGMDVTLPWIRPWTRRGEDARLSGQVRNAEKNAVGANPEPWPR